jgi:hypothetical protein
MRDMEPTFRLKIIVAITGLLAPLINTSPEECGERQLFAATSARYKAKSDHVSASFNRSEGPLSLAKGIDGQDGSGVYSIGVKSESSPPKIERLLEDLKLSGVAEKVWEYVLSDFRVTTGSEAVL